MIRKVFLAAVPRSEGVVSETFEQEHLTAAQVYVRVVQISPSVSLSFIVNAVLTDGTEFPVSSQEVTVVGEFAFLVCETAGAVLPSRYNVRVIQAGLGEATYGVEGDLY